MCIFATLYVGHAGTGVMSQIQVRRIWHYGVATTCRLLKIICLFCKRALWKRLYSAKETYNFKEPTSRSHPISASSMCFWSVVTHVWIVESISHVWVRFVTPMKESRHTYKSIMSHVSMSHITHMNGSCHAYEWVMWLIWGGYDL